MQRRLAAGLSALTVAAVAGPATAAWILPAGSGAATATAASLGAPTGVSAVAAGSTAIDVIFTPAPGQPAGTLTRVVRDRAVAGTTLVCTQGTSPCRDTGLAPGTTYGYTAQTVLSSWSKAAASGASATTTGTFAVTTSTLPAATVGTSYSSTLTASGGTTPYGWTVTAGTLPAGLSLSGAGAITGTPTAAGSSSFTVQAKDALGQTANAQLSIAVSLAAPTLAPGSDSGSSPSDRITNVNRPTLNGTAGGGATVTVFVDGTAVGSTTALANGSYSYQLPTALADGPRSITVGQTVSGSTSASSAALTVTIDTVAPAVPSGLAYDDQPNSTADLIKGTAEPSASVKATTGTTSYAVAATATGSFTLSVAALDGKSGTNGSAIAYSYSVSQTDVAGNLGPATTLSGNDTK